MRYAFHGDGPEACERPGPSPFAISFKPVYELTSVRMRSLIPRQLRQFLRGNAFLHGNYMRLKRRLTSQLVGMTSKTEQEFCARYGRELYTGAGEVVDLGCWLGSTTIPLVRGLRENRAFLDSGRKVFAYDLFVWFDWMNESVAGTNLVGRFQEGDSFLDEFEKRTSEYAEHIETRAGDLAEIGWSGGPIEFLLVDAMKNWDLANAIVREFYPHLVPGSLVLHQDFAHWLVPWIHVIQWKLRDHFELFEDIPRSQSVVFKLVRPVSAEMTAEKLSYESFSGQDVDEAFAYCLDVVTPEKRSNVAAAKVMWFAHQNNLSQAARVHDDLLREGTSLADDMITVRELIETRRKDAA
jgi:hypothetical protein